MNNTISKQEIIEWINFSYKDLLSKYVFIGGYNFTFDQLNDFLAQINAIESKITSVNNTIHINNHLIQDPRLNWQTMRLEKENKLLKEKIDFIKTKITAINKYSEVVTIPIEYNELLSLYNTLQYSKDEVEHFKTFCLEEVETVKEEDLPGFFLFVNDLFTEIASKFRPQN